MTVRRIEPGRRMSQAVVHGDTVYLAGQVGAPGESVADQTRAVLGQVDWLLAEAGSNKSRILSATIWLADIGDFAEMNGVWDAWIDPANPPQGCRFHTRCPYAQELCRQEDPMLRLRAAAASSSTPATPGSMASARARTARYRRCAMTWCTGLPRTFPTATSS